MWGGGTPNHILHGCAGGSRLGDMPEIEAFGFLLNFQCAILRISTEREDKLACPHADLGDGARKVALGIYLTSRAAGVDVVHFLYLQLGASLLCFRAGVPCFCASRSFREVWGSGAGRCPDAVRAIYRNTSRPTANYRRPRRLFQGECVSMLTARRCTSRRQTNKRHRRM